MGTSTVYVEGIPGPLGQDSIKEQTGRGVCDVGRRGLG